jgi:hypothetical protein
MRLAASMYKYKTLFPINKIRFESDLPAPSPADDSEKSPTFTINIIPPPRVMPPDGRCDM